MSIFSFILLAVEQPVVVGGLAAGGAAGGTAAYKHATSAQTQLTKLAQEHGKDILDLAMKGYEAAAAAILTAKQARQRDKLTTNFPISQAAASALVTKQMRPQELFDIGLRKRQTP